MLISKIEPPSWRPSLLAGDSYVPDFDLPPPWILSEASLTKTAQIRHGSTAGLTIGETSIGTVVENEDRNRSLVTAESFSAHGVMYERLCAASSKQTLGALFQAILSRRQPTEEQKLEHYGSAPSTQYTLISMPAPRRNIFLSSLSSDETPLPKRIPINIALQDMIAANVTFKKLYTIVLILLTGADSDVRSRVSFQLGSHQFLLSTECGGKLLEEVLHAHIKCKQLFQLPLLHLGAYDVALARTMTDHVDLAMLPGMIKDYVAPVQCLDGSISASLCHMMITKCHEVR